MKYAKIQALKLLLSLKPKIPKYREPNKRNAKGSSVTNKFSFKFRRRNLFKSKKGSKFCRHACMFKLILHTEAKSLSFSTTFAVILWAVALPIVPKVQFNFEAITYITIVFLSPGSCFKSMICIQNSLESANDHHVFAVVEGWKNSSPERLRTLYSLIFHSETT